MFWLVGTNTGIFALFMTKWMHIMYWNMQKLVNKVQMVTHQNTDQLKLSLQI